MRKIRIWMPAGITNPNCDLILRGATSVAENISLTEILPRCYEGEVTAAEGQYNINLISGTSRFGGDEVFIGDTDGLTYEAHMAVDWSQVLNQDTPVHLSQTRIGGYTGDGAFLVEITVQDTNAINLSGVTIRLTQGVNVRTAITNASGYAAFGLEAGNWNLTLSKAGYGFTPEDITISADDSLTKQMTINTIPLPSNPGLSTGYVYCYDINGVLEAGVEIIGFMTDTPGVAGTSHDSEGFVMTSDANGLATHPLVKNATYKFRRGTGKEEFVVALDADSTPLPPILGHYP